MTEYTSQRVEFVEKRVLGGERREGQTQRQRGRLWWEERAQEWAELIS